MSHISVIVSAILANWANADELLHNRGVEDGNGASVVQSWQFARVPADGLRMQRSDQHVLKGKWSLLIENRYDYERPVSNNWFQQILDPPRGATVSIAAAVRTQGVTAANVCVQCWSASGQMIGFASTPVLKGDQDWKTVASEPMRVPENTHRMIVRASLTGTGSVWFDELSLLSGSRDEAQGSPELVFATKSVDDGTESSSAVDGEQGAVRGISVLASRIEKDFTRKQILEFAKSCRLNLVVIDFAWITHHWPRTTDAAVALAEQLQDSGIDVMLMFRPRVLHTREADVSYLPVGNTGGARPNLDFRQEDSVRWGADWGAKLLNRFPTVNTVVVYNLLGPREPAKNFLLECRSQWETVRDGIQIGHVGPGDSFADVVDVAFPFVSVNRFDSRVAGISSQTTAVAEAKNENRDCQLIPLLKIDWGQSTDNHAEDIAAAIESCEALGTGFLIWNYESILGRPASFERRLLLKALGGPPKAVHTLVGKESKQPGQETKRVSEAVQMRQREWMALNSRESTNGQPIITVKTETGAIEIPCTADTNLISYLADKAWGRMTTLAISRNDTNRVLLAFPLDELPNVVKGATLRMKVAKSSVPLSAPLRIAAYRVKDPWNEKDCTWSNQPQFSLEPHILCTVEADDKQIELDLSALINAASDSGDTSLLLLLKSNTSNRNAFDRSSRSGAARPHLKIPPLQTSYEPLPWPHQPAGASEEEVDRLVNSVWIINDSPLYQADETGRRAYFHGGLDIVLDNGTPIFAIKDGWVKSVRNSTVAVADAKSDEPSFGWEYTHLGSIVVKPGDRVERGDLLGRVEFKGLPHLHLTKVYSQGSHWGDWSYVCYPNGHFTYPDTEPPVIGNEISFLANASREPFPTDDNDVAIVSGEVDVVVPMREQGEYARNRSSKFGDRLAVTRIEYVIRSEDGTIDERLESFDFEKLTYLKTTYQPEFNQRITKSVFRHWSLFESERPTGSRSMSYYVVTNFPFKGEARMLVPEWDANCWNTSQRNADGTSRYPNGQYRIIVRAIDFKGNSTEQAFTAKVMN